MSDKSVGPAGTAVAEDLQPSDVRRDRSLDLLRALAAGTVAVSHGVESVSVSYYSWEERWISPGRAGVIIFFLISGFLFASTRLQGSRKTFLVRRFWRIYPTYLVALVVFLALPVRDVVSGWTAVVANLFLVQSVVGAPSAVPPAWTLPIELLFYALLFLGIPMGRVRWGRFFWWTWALAAMTTLISLQWAIALPTSIPLLVVTAFLGGLIRHAADERRARVIRALVAYLALVLLVAASQVETQSPLEFTWSVRGYVLSTMVGLAVFLGLRGRVPKLFKPVTWVGDVSYSLYLIHPLGYLLLAAMPISGVVKFVCYVPAALCLAASLHYAVERPALLVGRRRARRRHA